MSANHSSDHGADTSNRTRRPSKGAAHLDEEPGGIATQKPSPGESPSLERIQDMTSLKAGDQVTVRSGGDFHYPAEIDEVALHLGVAWIRDMSLGLRRMVRLDELWAG